MIELIINRQCRNEENMGKISKHTVIKIILLISLLMLVIVFSASVGSADLSMADSFRIMLSRIPLLKRTVDVSDIKQVYFTIVFNIRLPRICLAGLTGCGLAVSGAAYQGLFRNALADPHVLGVSSGAAVGATFAILSGINISFLGLGAVGLCAFAGAMLTIIFVYSISITSGRLPVVQLLLAGTAVSSLLSSIISLFMTFNKEGIEKVYMWTLGSFSAANWTKVLYLLIFAAAVTLGIMYFSRELNMLMLGEDTAESLGVNINKIERLLIVISSLLVAACVSVSGIIGFVGLIIPHCMRMLCGVDYKRLIPFACFGGAIFMIICDTAARTIAAPSEIPVGIITSILGAPYFIYLIKKNKKKISL